jgi:hypothetical protein
MLTERPQGSGQRRAVARGAETEPLLRAVGAKFAEVSIT